MGRLNQDGAQITLQSTSKGTFMSAEGGGGEQMVVNRAIVSTWETFKVGPILCQLRSFKQLWFSSKWSIGSKS